MIEFSPSEFEEKCKRSFTGEGRDTYIKYIDIQPDGPTRIFESRPGPIYSHKRHLEMMCKTHGVDISTLLSGSVKAGYGIVYEGGVTINGYADSIEAAFEHLGSTKSTEEEEVTFATQIANTLTTTT